MTALRDRIAAMLESPLPANGTRSRELAQIERTLTDGFAVALALEAERMRLHERIGQAASELHADRDTRAVEISFLARRLAETEDELVSLRAMLKRLRGREREIRAESWRDTGPAPEAA